jgi:hypothetical protein
MELASVYPGSVVADKVTGGGARLIPESLESDQVAPPQIYRMRTGAQMSEPPPRDEGEGFLDLDKAYPSRLDKSPNKKVEKILVPLREYEKQHGLGTREHAHLMLDVIMDLQQLQMGHGYALDLANLIVHNNMKWIQDGPLLQKRLKNWGGHKPDSDMPYDQGAIVEVLTLWPMVIPDDMHDFLQQAIMDLRNSTRPLSSLFRREALPTNLMLAQDAEERMWRWVAYQMGQGETSDQAVRQVADAVGRTTSAVRQWRKEWRGRVGDTFVKDALSTARQLSRKAASGQWRYDWIRSSTAEEFPAAENNGADPQPVACQLIYLFCDERGLLPSNGKMFSRYEEEAHVFSEHPDTPLRTLARIWKRTRSLPPHDEIGAVTRQ